MLAWFVQRFLPGMSLVVPERSEVIAWGMLDVALSALFVAAVFAQRLQAPKLFALRARHDRAAFCLLGVWCAACTFNVIRGLIAGNDLNYLIGDSYRFGSMPILIAAVYYAVQNAAGVQRLVRGFAAAYGVMVGVDLFRFNSYLLANGQRLTTETAHEAGMMASLLIFLALYDPRSGWRRISITVLVLLVFLLLRAQMITPLITCSMVLALYFLFSRKITLLLGCTVAVAVVIVASAYIASIMPTVPSYISDKLVSAQDYADPLESLQALSGVRSGEIISISEDLAAHPAHLLFGTGAGSLVSPDPVIPVERLMIDKHYIHAGLFDALYHNGAAGALVLLLFAAHLLRRAYRQHRAGQPFGQLALVTVTVTLVQLAYDMPLESSIPVVALCFAGIAVYDLNPFSAASRGW